MTVLGNQILVDPATWRAVDDATDNQVATSGGGTILIPEAGFITSIGVWCRRPDTTIPKGYVGVWIDDDGNAGDLLGRTALLSVPNTGGNMEGPVAASASEVNTAIRVMAGDIIWVGAKFEQGNTEVGQLSGAVKLNTKTVGGGVPTSPFTPDTTPTDQDMAFYVIFTPNTAPNAPTNLDPVDGSATSSLTPTLSATFSDPDASTPTFDQLGAYEFEVRKTSDDSLLWYGAGATIAASDLERETGDFSAAYNGTSLSGIGDVIWRVRTYDLSGEPGEWSDDTALTINQGGIITPTYPVDKVDGPTNEITWEGHYDHPNGFASQQMQIRVLVLGLVGQHGRRRVYKWITYREGDAFTKVVSDDTDFVVASNADGSVGKLATGTTFRWQIRVKANNVWSAWQTGLEFRTNAIPQIPSALQPPDGTTASTRPRLSWKGADPDEDDIEGTDVRWEVEITPPGGSPTVYTVTDWDDDEGEAFLQTTSTHVPSTNVLPYRWRVRSQDISASDGYSEWSEYQEFFYVSGLVVTITAPAENAAVNVSTPTLTWTISSGTQSQWRAQIFKRNHRNPWFDTGVQNGSQLSRTIDLTFFKNHTEWDVMVWSKNTGGSSGWSARRGFKIEYDPTEGVTNPQCSLYTFPRDPEPTAVLFSWGLSGLQMGEFNSYNVYRRYVGQDFEDATRIKKIKNMLQTTWIDSNAPADKPVIYSVTVVRKIGKEKVESDPVEAQIDLNLTVVVLSSVTRGHERLIARWKPFQRKYTHEQRTQLHDTWGTDGLPTAVFMRGIQQTADLTFQLVGDDEATLRRHYAAGRALVNSQTLVMVRDEDQRFVGYMRSFEADKNDFKYVIHARFEQVAWDEGEDA